MPVVVPAQVPVQIPTPPPEPVFTVLSILSVIAARLALVIPETLLASLASSPSPMAPIMSDSAVTVMDGVSKSVWPVP